MIQKKPRMYHERKANINAIVGCGFHCIYCAFAPLQARFGKCPDCMTFTPHEHPEALDKAPPKTKDNEFITIGLNGDLSFVSKELMERIADYCYNHSDRTFLLQSKNPACFLDHQFSKNVIIGATIESNVGAWWYKGQGGQIHYDSISKAPLPIDRYEAMVEFKGRKEITVEPILDFDWQFDDGFSGWIKAIKPEFVYVGYGNEVCRKLKLPEPSIEKTKKLIADIRGAGIEVREKNMRPAWWETGTGEP